jgi:hypothetical protein
MVDNLIAADRAEKLKGEEEWNKPAIFCFKYNLYQ